MPVLLHHPCARTEVWMAEPAGSTLARPLSGYSQLLSTNTQPPLPRAPRPSSSQATRVYGTPTVLWHGGLLTQAADPDAQSGQHRAWWAQRGHSDSVDSGPVRKSMALRGRTQWDVPGWLPILPAVTMPQLLGRPGFLCRNSLRGDLTLQMPPPGSPFSLANTSSEPHTPTASKSPPTDISDTRHLLLRRVPC